MKKKSTLLLVLALLMTLTLPFVLPSGAMLDAERSRMMDELWEEEEQDEGSFLHWLLPRASAEGSFEPLPIDFTPGQPLDPEGFSDDGYTDSSIELRLETLEMDNIVCKVAYIAISDASQLRTATAGKPASSRVALISSMAEKNNAVIAINANYLSNDPVKTSFEYRMGQKIRNKPNRTKDLLIINENADFNLFIKSDKDEIQAFEDAGHAIINAFTFGPALVKNGELLTLDDNYGYNPNGREPRLAIGQIAPLNYIIVLVEGRSKDSQGVTHEELAGIMFDLGSMQAFNLDGGNSATMVFNGGYYQNKSKSNERAQSDMIYFASLRND
jgi:exopolysaccharide biosynthesis protein